MSRLSLLILSILSASVQLGVISYDLNVGQLFYAKLISGNMALGLIASIALLTGERP